MKTKLTPIQILGLCLMPVSMTVFYFVPHTRETLQGAALLNYPIAMVYFLLSFADRPKDSSIFKSPMPKLNWHIVLSLMMVSCFTLNKDIHIFAITPVWLKIALPLTLFAFIFIGYTGEIPQWAGKMVSFFTGLGLLIFAYYAIVLLPFSPLAIIGLVLLGLSIHLLVPIFLLTWGLIATFKVKYHNAHPKMVLSGATTGIMVLLLYVIIYSYHDKQIKGAQKDLVLNEGSNLPEWVAYAQNSTSEYWTKRIIGKKLLYEVHSDGWWDFDFNRGSFSDIKKHDPLVAIADLFTSELTFSNQDQVKILSSNTNSRHYAYEKLWSGRNLKVNKELTDVRIYPAYRMVYFEKTIWIENTSTNNRSQQEALFTFYLPDGAVASSLSLWIDGKEEKSRLTTRKKASKAYKTIVGRERRDPVVLHWQEGNRLTATIFPCTPKESRRVKIGITAPLLYKNNRLYFQSMRVQGPENSQAHEVTHVKLVGKANSVKMPGFFSEALPNQYIYEGKPVGSWSCSLNASPLTENPFTFNKQSYQIKPIEYAHNRIPKAIYLDINQSWNEKEVKQIMSQAGSAPVYVHDHGFMQLELANFDMLIHRLTKRPFSLMPVFEIDWPESALIITKGKNNSPIPSELKSSVFHNRLITYLSEQTKSVATIVLDHMKSPYITSLEQLKLIDCRNMTIAELQGLQIENWFKEYRQIKGGVNISMSHMAIVPAVTNKDNTAQIPRAPSHLLRLYNYHTVMQKAGNLFLQEDATIPKSVYHLCNEAFIVTPVSSLIVLESQKDYDRFDIKKNKNSLQNANLQDSGAVPEPHEWALIIALGAILCFVYFKFG
ncbi:XrtN system VIT domain-containing protein [Saccharicrinis sp. GN24d3]|uniref:XrtN system VIT domain-containing protein n=1 Tax=Saccharicrinis sp. GN24d3 TaxID=3458416 RepID=UPI004035E837